MKRFEQLSIRNKLIRIIVMVTAVVLLPSVAAIVLIDFYQLRDATIRKVTVLAQAIAYNSSAALAFEDPEDGASVLQALQAEPNVLRAALYDLDRVLFAAYSPEEPEDDAIISFPEDLQEQQAVRRNATLHYLIRVWEGDTHLGWLLIQYDLQTLRQRLLFYAGMAILVATVSLAIAYSLSVVLQSRISGPILALEHIARQVSREHDYGVRAQKSSDDEIGSLTQTFNEMLEQIAAKEAALRISEERLRTAVDASRIGVWDWDLRTRQATWIGPLYQSIGLQENIGDTDTEAFFEVVHPEDRDDFRRKLADVATRKTAFEADFRITAPGGEIFHIRSRGRTIADEGDRPQRMVGVIIDVTDLRMAQAEILDLNRNLEKRVEERTAELRRALGEIEAFNYSVSHDLRAPLRGINGFSRALLEDYQDKLDEAGKDFLNRIVASCQRMGQLIDDLLKLSRITQQEIRKRKVDLSAMAREVVGNLREADPDRVVDVKIQEGLTAEGDPRLLTVVLDNLLQNAWKFTSKKAHARIEVGSERNGKKEVFFVRDNGAGFDMSFASNLFGVFQRLHKTTEFEGTGIGLATVRRIVERHGGEVWATGALDHGATFYFTIPSHP